MAANTKAFYQLDIAETYGRTAAAVYERICYWEERSEHEHDGAMWMWRTLEQLAVEVAVSVSTIRRAIARLVGAGLILKQRLLKKRWRQVCFYRTTRERQPDRPEPVKTNESSRKGFKDLEITLNRARTRVSEAVKRIVNSVKEPTPAIACHACEDSGWVHDEASSVTYACLCSAGRSKAKHARPAPQDLFVRLRNG